MVPNSKNYFLTCTISTISLLRRGAREAGGVVILPTEGARKAGRMVIRQAEEKQSFPRKPITQNTLQIFHYAR